MVTRIVAGLSRTSEGLDVEMTAWECKHLRGHGSAVNFTASLLQSLTFKIVLYPKVHNYKLRL